MRKITFAFVVGITSMSFAQTNPAITSWLQNTTGIIGSYYVQGNSTPISNGLEANVQSVQYSANWVYINTNGIPAYATGPFMDGNPSLAEDQNAIFKFPLNPTENAGTATATNMGNIGVFINGVALFDFRDGVAWNTSTSALCGGPGNPPCPGGPTAIMDWNRDAVPAEKPGFDCSKGHPAMGNYHHHQNPSAFNLDLNIISTVCDLYQAEGLYTINSSEHSPLIGFAYDGFPIYGAYAFTNSDGTGGISRMKSGYQLRNITTRTTSPTGASVSAGPAVNTTYFLGYFKEDYEFISHPGQDDYLDEHNGRFCITPEYPAGIYCYFATVDANYNSFFPYVIGPTFFGDKVATTVTTIGEAVTTYTSSAGIDEQEAMEFNVFPNPTSDILIVQQLNLTSNSVEVQLIDAQGRLVQSNQILQGSTFCSFDVSTMYSGTYYVKIINGATNSTHKVMITE